MKKSTSSVNEDTEAVTSDIPMKKRKIDDDIKDILKNKISTTKVIPDTSELRRKNLSVSMPVFKITPKIQRIPIYKPHVASSEEDYNHKVIIILGSKNDRGITSIGIHGTYKLPVVRDSDIIMFRITLGDAKKIKEMIVFINGKASCYPYIIEGSTKWFKVSPSIIIHEASKYIAEYFPL